MDGLFDLRESLRGQLREVRVYGNRHQWGARQIAMADTNQQILIVSEEIRERMLRLNEKARQKEITESGSVMREPRKEMGLTLKSFAQLPGAFVNKLKRRTHGKFSRRAAYVKMEVLLVAGIVINCIPLAMYLYCWIAHGCKWK
jgi:hypothetical protein